LDQKTPDEHVPYTFVVGKDLATSRVEYRGERLPGIAAAAVVVGGIGNALEITRGEAVAILLKVHPHYVRIVRDEATLCGGTVGISYPADSPFSEP